jgi:putative toxin-antitoxin system antitoxin component (TIGR02293 family)
MAATGLANVDRLRQHIARGVAHEHFYVSLLGLNTYDARGIHDRVEEGFSFDALERLRRALDVPLSRFADLVRIPPRTLARRKEARRLQPDESDRLLRLARIVGLAIQLFEGGLAEARTWLMSSHPALGNQVPLEFAASEVGAREVENLIGRLEHGIPL